MQTPFAGGTARSRASGARPPGRALLPQAGPLGPAGRDEPLAWTGQDRPVLKPTPTRNATKRSEYREARRGFAGERSEKILLRAEALRKKGFTSINPLRGVNLRSLAETFFRRSRFRRSEGVPSENFFRVTFVDGPAPAHTDGMPTPPDCARR